MKMTNTKTGDIYAMKIMKSCLIYHEKEFLRRVYLFQNNLPGLIPVYKYLLPLFRNEKNNINLTKIEVTNEAGEVILKTFQGYIVISKYMKNGNLENILYESKEYKLNSTIRSKIIYGVASIMKQFHGKNVVFLNLDIDNVFLDDNFEPLIGFHLGYFHCKKLELRLRNHPFIISTEFNYNIFNFENDVFAFGFFLYELFDQNVCKFIIDIRFHSKIHKPENIPLHYWKLICSCVDLYTIERPTFNDITTILKNDLYALNEYGIKTDLLQLHEYQNRIDYKGIPNDFYFFLPKYKL